MASILSLARVPQKALAPDPVATGFAPGMPARLHFWRGASGRRYVHVVYSLLECPPLPRANVMLVRRDDRGRRIVLHVATGSSEATTLNLAQVRQRGASLGANEVHVHFLAGSEEQRGLIACDLRAGQFGTLAAHASCAAQSA
jgi:hypothetical protein